MRRQLINEQETVNCIIQTSKDFEATTPYKAKAVLLGAKSLLYTNFALQYEAFLLEKRLKNVKGTADNFEQLVRRFGPHIRKDISEIVDAVRACTYTSGRGKETPEQQFLYEVFMSLSKDVQMEALLQCSEFTPVLFEKCQSMLLLVKLFPDTINQKNGGDLLFTLLACESDAYSTFRKLLVEELVPSVLQLSQNLTASPRFITLLDQCIEYYVLVAGIQKGDNGEDDRWEKLYQIVDQIGGVLQWHIAPFFRGAVQSSGANSVEALFQALQTAYQHMNHYSVNELAYVTVVVFLRCIVAYQEFLRSYSSSNFDAKSKLTLVEIFAPRPRRGARTDGLPTLTSVSNCSTIGGNQSQVVQHFLTAVKVWEMVKIKGDPVEKEFFGILYSMKSLDLEHWDAFKGFTMDHRTYLSMHYTQDLRTSQSHIKMASMCCSVNHYKVAAEYAIKAVAEAVQNDPANLSNDNYGTKDDFSFFSPHIYNSDSKGNFIFQHRVHFLSENRSEIIAYAANILIRCFHDSLEIAAPPQTTAHRDDRRIGHLLTLLQLEWPSPPAEMLFSQILEMIRRNGSFRYMPYFMDFIIEPDFLEQFMSISNHEKAVQLELFPAATPASTGSRRIGTRGVEKGSKTEFNTSMRRQIMKNGRENLESIIIKFLTLNKNDILSCFDYL